MERSNEALERSNDDLKRFAHIASHDLQSPLRSVVSMLGLLEKRNGEALDIEGREYLNRAVNAGVRMSQLIRDLMTYSRVDYEAVPFDSVDMNVVAAEVLNDLHDEINLSNAKITIAELPVVGGDEAQLKDLLRVLVSNSMMYRSDDSPEIQVEALPGHDEWQFSVSDNGIGIKPEYQKQIFTMLQRLHSREEYPGTGIGLAICRRVAGRHGGRIWVESEYGQGSCFRFTISRSLVEAEAK